MDSDFYEVGKPNEEANECKNTYRLYLSVCPVLYISIIQKVFSIFILTLLVWLLIEYSSDRGKFGLFLSVWAPWFQFWEGPFLLLDDSILHNVNLTNI